MTMYDLFRLVVRRWYVYALGLLIVVSTAVWLDNSPRIYTATAELQFVQPTTLPEDIAGKDQRDTLIKFAGAVARKYDDAYPNLRLSSPSASIFGNGTREGIAVHLAAVGNQWTTTFVRPVIQIQIATPDGDSVLPKIREVASKIDAIALAMQDGAGAAKNYEITTSVDLDLVTVNSFGHTRTGRVSGAGVLFGATMILATLTAIGLDKLARLRARPLAQSRAATARV